jgi:hypothetical protein
MVIMYSILNLVFMNPITKRLFEILGSVLDMILRKRGHEIITMIISLDINIIHKNLYLLISHGNIIFKTDSFGSFL